MSARRRRHCRRSRGEPRPELVGRNLGYLTWRRERGDRSTRQDIAAPDSGTGGAVGDRAARTFRAPERCALLRADDARTGRHPLQVQYRSARRASFQDCGGGAVIKLDREQILSVGALAALLLICTVMTGLSLQMRSNAAQELAERHELVSRL